MNIVGNLIQNGIPTPDNPIDIETEEFIEVNVNGEKKRIKISKDLLLKKGDAIKKIQGEWYLIRGGDMKDPAH